MRLRIATFNVENLASRHSFGPRERPETAPALSLFDFPQAETREQVEASVAVAIEDDKRELTALAIAETRADIIALQEVDNLSVLSAFFANYVHRISDIRYGHFKLVDGNDPRGIDVAFAARKSLVAADKVVVTSHHEASFAELGCYDEALKALGIEPGDRVFNRDCLEVALDLGEARLTLYLCHFKAVTATGRTAGRDGTLALRQAEAKAVRRLIENRFGKGWRDANWIVAGDLNDFRARILAGGGVEAATPSSFDALLGDFAVDPAEALPACRALDELLPSRRGGRRGGPRGARAARLHPRLAGDRQGQPGAEGRDRAARAALSRAARSGGARPLDGLPRDDGRPLPPRRLGPPESQRPLPGGGRDRFADLPQRARSVRGYGRAG